MVSGSMNTVSEISKSTQLAGTCDGWLMWRNKYAFAGLHGDDGRHLNKLEVKLSRASS